MESAQGQSQNKLNHKPNNKLQDNLVAIQGLSPPSLWRHFAALASIPRPSGAEAAVLAYIEGVAQKHRGLCRRDQVGNLLVVVPGHQAPGQHLVSPLAFQCHVDMVCEQNGPGSHDFHRDSIALTGRADKPGWIFGTGTTLGADNGIGVAAMLALMEDSAETPGDLEFLFTVDEETGLTGAQGLDPGLLKAKTLLNLDTEEEGALYVGCAGGLDLDAQWAISRLKVKAPFLEAFSLQVSGLKGGHSGIDIDKQRGNAIKLLAFVLDDLFREVSSSAFQVTQLSGGKARNAIPREAMATVLVAQDSKNQVLRRVKTLEATLKKVYQEVDPLLSITLTSNPDRVEDLPIDRGSMVGWLKGVLGFSSQPYRFELGIPGLVRTSSNLGVLQSDFQNITVRSKLRSSSDLELEILQKELTSILEVSGGLVQAGGGYCGWQPDLTSQLLETAQSVHTQVFGQKAHIKAIHAGLECGLIGSKYPGIKMISFGPNIVNAHSPDESVEVASVERFWLFLKALVGRLQQEKS